MTERTPLITSSPDAFERALLRSSQRDRPDAHALARTASALGVSAIALASAANAAAGAQGAASTVTTGIAAATSTITVLKALALGALVGAALSLGASVAFPGTPAARRSAPAPLQRLAAGAPSDFGAVSLPSTEPSPVLPEPSPVLPTPTLLGAPSAAVPQRSKPAEVVAEGVPRTEPVALSSAAPSTPAVARFASPPSSSMADEVAAIDRARRALRSGHTSDALRELARYREEFPSGVLTMESIILRVEAELKLGDRAAAERDAAKVIEAQPGSRYASRLRALFAPVTPITPVTPVSE